MNDLLTATGLTKTYGSGKHMSYALKDVSVAIAGGESLAIVGESGSGKSTLALAILKLVDLDHGEIRLNGTEILKLKGSELRKMRSQIGVVFQNPMSALNPRMRILDSITEPLRVLSEKFRKDDVLQLMSEVGLAPDIADRYPSALSGGQRQRVAIARALITKPQLLILDEPTTALDVSVQSQILALLNKLRRDHSLSYLFITHNLALVPQIADRIVVLRSGQVVEEGSVEETFVQPKTSYTKELIEAVPGAALFELTDTKKISPKAPEG
jgi:peptide/nickel transport system ATP-binding protein